MQWKIIADFPNYEVSEFGDMRRRDSGRLRSPVFCHGYKRFGLIRDGKQVHEYAHRLVAKAFIGPAPFEKADVCHNDGTRANSHYSNLRWDTRTGNNADKRAHGTMPYGARHSNAKLAEPHVVLIRSLVAEGRAQAAVARQFGISQGQVRRILNRLQWAHVA